MLLVLMFLIGLALIAAPFVPQVELGMSSEYTLALIGVITCVVVSVAGAVSKFYRKASANMAFVLTGGRKARVIVDGGAIVVPVVHNVVPVSLETMRLNVERRGPHALITKDNLRVDLSAEFYIKLQANAEDILQAARSLGDRSVEAEA